MRMMGLCLQNQKLFFPLKSKIFNTFFLKKINDPNKKIKKLINKSILKKKWIRVIKNETIIRPRNRSKKKLFFVLKFVKLP